jgi:hypothetical protein
MEQLEDKIKQYKSAAKNVAIGLGVAAVGFTFDYGIVDDIIIIGGCFTAGWNTRDTINYIRYSLRKDKPTEYKE